MCVSVRESQRIDAPEVHSRTYLLISCPPVIDSQQSVISDQQSAVSIHPEVSCERSAAQNTRSTRRRHMCDDKPISRTYDQSQANTITQDKLTQSQAPTQAKDKQLYT